MVYPKVKVNQKYYRHTIAPKELEMQLFSRLGKRSVLLCIVAIFLGQSFALAQPNPTPRVLRFGIGLGEDHPQGQAVKHLAQLVKERSKGRLHIELFAGGQLGNDISMTDALRKGTLDMTAPDTSSLVRFNKGFGVINFPFLLDSESDADFLLDSSFGAELLASLPKEGLQGLGFWENGFRNLTNNRGAVTKRKDFQDLKVRVMPNAMFADAFKALDAAPTQIPFPEVYASLREGRVQAQENPLITIYASKFYEVQNHLTLTRHAYSAWAVLIGQSTWGSLNATDQALLRSAVSEATLYERKLIRERNQQMVEELRKLGMTVSEITREELPLIRLRARKVIDKYTDEYGRDWTRKLYMQLAANEQRKLKRLAQK
jgi:TRAP-type transport system periplasmic protein